MWILINRCQRTEKAYEELKQQNKLLQETFCNEIIQNRRENTINIQNLREENFQQAGHFNEMILTRLNENFQAQMGQLGIFSKQTVSLTEMNERKLEQVRETVERNLQKIQTDNNMKLEAIRETVDEKLNRTLEKRLGESFRLVSERLETVHKGIGQMQTLAAGVGDLKRVLTNIKVRGIWGEIQLEKLLSEILTREQYAVNVATKPNSNERVEFAIKL
ncbi:MAG: DNA recombination protein RmuC, partial [Selenomonadales bacterium]|nr:DNA recombination protein RmuC [Selenomonadales bacterium]